MIYFFNLLCGIGLFLYGMKIMSEGTEKAFGERLRRVLSVATGTRLRAILTGTAVTGAIQSSTAVTVMTVGFVEAGILSIFQATGIVLGANIGTTVTSLLIAFNFTYAAYICIFLGALPVIIAKKQIIRHIGEIILGFGMLFLGLKTMSSAFTFLKENPDFLAFIVAYSKGKIKGIIAGTVMTLIMQSSSATVGILQSLCMQGLIDTESALYIVLGQNIGTVFTSILSSAGKSRKARQVGMIHLIFNLAGSILFLFIGELIPFASLFEKIGNPSMQVSAFHIAFNVITVIAAVPLYSQLIALSEKAVRFRILTAKSKACPSRPSDTSPKLRGRAVRFSSGKVRQKEG